MSLSWFKEENKVFDNVPEEEGIYIISTMQSSDDKYEVKYLGQASDLKNRAKEHWSNNEQNEKLKKHIEKNYAMKFSYAIVKAQKDRDSYEKFLYFEFDPIFNLIEPPGDEAKECNTPEVRKRK